MKRIIKYISLILVVVTVLLFGTDTKAYAAQNQEMNLYGIIGNNSICNTDILGLLLSLDEIERRYRDMIAAARKAVKNVAADNLEHFLGASGTTRILDWNWLRSFSSVVTAEKKNIKRFEEALKKKAETLLNGDNIWFYDYWDRIETASSFSELYYASGTFTLTSYGQFFLSRNGNCISITGNIDHYWWDPYDWHAGLAAYVPGFGSVSDEDALRLEKAGRAMAFLMESEWTQEGKGSYVIRKFWFDSFKMNWSLPTGGSSGVHNTVIQQKGQAAVRPMI